MTPLNSKSILIVAAGALAGLMFAQTARAGQSYDTTPSWDGATPIQYFGLSSSIPANTPTFGETFVAPVGNTVLNSFTFYVGSSDGASDPNSGNYLPDVSGDQYQVQGEVFNWTGSLIGGNGSQGTTGPALFTSPSFTITSNGAFQAVTVNIAGGVSLTAGDSYVVDLTDLNAPQNEDFGIFGLTEFSHVPNDGGGGFAYSNVGAAGTWDDSSDFGDLAFKANFSAPVSNGVPDAAGTALLLGLGLAGLAFLPRRRSAAARS